MKTIRRFSNIAEAGFSRSILQAAGIDAALADEHAFTLGPQYAPWGIRLQVPDSDVERAARVLDQQEGFLPLPDDFVPPPESPEPAGTPPQPGASLGGAFVRGGFVALAIFGGIAGISLLVGGHAHADLGGLVLLFAIGGVTGIAVRAIYLKGRRDVSADPGSA